LYLVASGRVKVSRVAADGYETTVRIVPREELFGECSLINADGGERAVALDWVNVMSWSKAEIEHQIEKTPGLGLALLEEFVIAAHDMEDRVQALATRTTPERVMLSLLQLQRTLGEPQADGFVRMASLSHIVIAQHVGTSREIVSAQMSRLRSFGMIRYSRKYIDVDCAALEQALLNGGPALQPRGAVYTLARSQQPNGEGSHPRTARVSPDRCTFPVVRRLKER
jgi:CRP-like cAMP-binding protein